MTNGSDDAKDTFGVIERTADMLGGSSVLHGDVRTWAELEEMVRRGLPKRALQLVAERALGAEVPISAFVYSVVPAATYKRRSKLSAQESERTARLARVIALAESVWGSVTEARAFLNEPHPLLGNREPLDLARTDIGARLVEDLLYSIAYGLPA